MPKEEKNKIETINPATGKVIKSYKFMTNDEAKKAVEKCHKAFLDWKIPLLNPPKGLSAANHDVLPHIRIDTILNELIGDKCR